MNALTSMEAAKVLGIAPKTLANWRNLLDGPPYYKLRGRVYYAWTPLIAWARQNTKIGILLNTGVTAQHNAGRQMQIVKEEGNVKTHGDKIA